MCMFYLLTKFHKRNSSSVLVIAIKSKATATVALLPKCSGVQHAVIIHCHKLKVVCWGDLQ
jgi:hypothetical protein